MLSKEFFSGTKGWMLKGEQFEAIATVILRVPGYFILDYWYQNDIRNCIPRSLAWADVVSSGFAIFGRLFPPFINIITLVEDLINPLSIICQYF